MQMEFLPMVLLQYAARKCITYVQGFPRGDYGTDPGETPGGLLTVLQKLQLLPWRSLTLWELTV